MRIALIIFHANPTRGGAERYTADLAAALAARGHEVSLLALDFGPPIEKVTFVPLPVHGLTRAGKFAHWLRSLNDHLSRNVYDIVHAMLPVPHCDLYHPHAGLAAEKLSENWSNRFVPRRRMFASIERQLLCGDRPPVVLCLSDYVKKSIPRFYTLPQDHLATLFNAVDLNRFQADASRREQDRLELKIPAERIVALMVAQDFARKGLTEAISALKELNDNRLLLLVVGGDNPSRFARLAKMQNVAGQIRFIGQVADPRPFYRAADFFLLPTHHDPCSLVVLESLAMGLPVISTAQNGACEIMESGRHGFVLPDSRDIPAITNAIRQMLDPAARAMMSHACLELRQSLSFDQHVDRLLTIYDECKIFAQKSAPR